jgi:ATP-dependent 26S proteasome regulatory subunit
VRQNNKNQVIANLIFVIVIISLLAVIIFKPAKEQPAPSIQPYLDSIKSLQTVIDASKIRQSKLQSSYDSLLNLEPIVIYKTREKVKFIFNTNDPDVLDSIIRSGWKTRPRYN